MKQQVWSAIFCSLCVLTGCLLAQVTDAPVPSVPQLTDAQQLTFQKSLSAFYLAAANLATAEGALLQAQQRLEAARADLKPNCPGEIVDVKEKPAECRLKVEVPPPGTNGAGVKDVKPADTVHQLGTVKK